ncbi:alpha-2,8-polysialyltransferase family protein [Pseudomonas sp. BF-B-27]|uniref:alpha-2,8-polysialyltransferase family protein n=1 Tax=Pseudomonas sp. BF-B-27 TaxID=2832354 RepID=UPI001CBE3E89|nr:alpha-2,8-polysialyltransferase family protein [Pseudomonas sp. BF-B-27]
MRSIVIAHCSSWYHFLGLYAYLNSQKKKYSEIHLIHEGFLQKKAKIPTYAVSIFCDNLKVYENIDHLQKVLAPKGKIKQDVIIITTNAHPTKLLSITKKANSVETIQIEEGIGSYGNFKQLVLARLRESKGYKRKLIALPKIALRELAIKIVPHLAKKTSFLMFSRDGKTINNEVVSSYREALHDLSTHTDCSHLDVSKLVISSPFTELGMISADKYTKTLTQCLGDISGNVFIKAHPLEEHEKFKHLNLVTDEIPVELLILKNSQHLKEIYCFSSTAIYTCHLLLGITPKRISELDLFYKNFSLEQRRIIDKCCDII